MRDFPENNSSLPTSRRWKWSLRRQVSVSSSPPSCILDFTRDVSGLTDLLDDSILVALLDVTKQHPAKYLLVTGARRWATAFD